MRSDAPRAPLGLALAAGAGLLFLLLPLALIFLYAFTTDERSYTFDAQHRVTTTTRMIYRVDSPAGVENWAASIAHWQPWYQASPEIRARVITRDGREYQLDQKLLRDAARRANNQVYDDSHVLEGPLPAISVGAVIEEQERTIADLETYIHG